jgi:hypothetical protein
MWLRLATVLDPVERWALPGPATLSAALAAPDRDT